MAPKYDRAKLVSASNVPDLTIKVHGTVHRAPLGSDVYTIRQTGDAIVGAPDGKFFVYDGKGRYAFPSMSDADVTDGLANGEIERTGSVALSAPSARQARQFRKVARDVHAAALREIDAESAKDPAETDEIIKRYTGPAVQLRRRPVSSPTPPEIVALTRKYSESAGSYAMSPVDAEREVERLVSTYVSPKGVVVPPAENLTPPEASPPELPE